MPSNFLPRRWPWSRDTEGPYPTIVYNVFDAREVMYDTQGSLMDTPEVPLAAWCPVCDPAPNPLDNMTHLCYCQTHTPALDGQVTPSFPEGEFQGEAGGTINTQACNIIHRGQTGT